MTPVHALVLAAGLGQRFGGAKLLASYRGRPLLSYSLEVVRRAIDQRLLQGGCVVVASADESTAALVREAGLELVRNPDPSAGLSHSLRLGLEALEQDSSGVGAALVFLGDEPLVRADVVEAVIGAWRAGAGPVVRPRYLGRPSEPGHPTLLARPVWPLARRIAGDAGFSAALVAGGIEPTMVDVAGSNPDVDTPADLLQLEDFPR